MSRKAEYILISPTPEHCPECGGTIVEDPRIGEYYCSRCGLVTSVSVDTAEPYHEDWRNSRFGSPLNAWHHDRGLSTEIGRIKRGTSDKVAEAVYKIKRAHKRSTFSNRSEKKLATTLTEISRIAGVLLLPETVRETAAELCWRGHRSGLFKGKKIESVAAGLVYAACRVHGCMIAPDRVARVASVSVRDVSRTYRQIIRNLKVKPKVPDYKDYVGIIAAQLFVAGKERDKIDEIVSAIEESEVFIHRCPRAIAAAIVYLACSMTKSKRTQKEIAEIADVSEATLRETTADIVRLLCKEV